ncbi:MAG: redoxin family protein [Acidimicrobiales bacterium]
MIRGSGRRLLTPLRLGMAALGVGVVALGLVLALQPSQGTVEAATPLLGRESPPLSGPSLGGSAVSPAGLRDRWLVVSFFASWCVDCQVEAPQLETFQAQEAPGARIVMVDGFGDSASAARSFLRRSHEDWSAIADPGGATALAWGVRAPPETFVVNPHGTVVAKFVGPVESAQLERVMLGGGS